MLSHQHLIPVIKSCNSEDMKNQSYLGLNAAVRILPLGNNRPNIPKKWHSYRWSQHWAKKLGGNFSFFCSFISTPPYHPNN